MNPLDPANLIRYESKVERINDNLKELIRLNKLFLLGRSDVEIPVIIHSGVKTVSANDEETVLSLPKRICAIGDIQIEIHDDTDGTYGPSYVGFKEFIYSDKVDRGTIYEAYAKGLTSPRHGIFVSYFDDVNGNYVYGYSNMGSPMLRVSKKEYDLIIYNNDDTSHDVQYAIEITYLDIDELMKGKKS